MFFVVFVYMCDLNKFVRNICQKIVSGQVSYQSGSLLRLRVDQ